MRDNRREEIAAAAQVSISEFRAGKLKAKSATEVISDLRICLHTEDVADNELERLKCASTKLDKLLQQTGISEDILVTEFQQLREQQ